MTLWTDFRDDFLRHVISDTATGPFTDDATLLVFANQALSILSEEVGLASYDDLTGAGPTYNLPTDFVAAKLLEMTYNDEIEYLLETVIRPGDTRRNTTGTRPDNFLIHWPSSGSLSLFSTPDTGYAYRLHYYASFPAIAADASLPFGTEAWLEVALAMYIGYLIMGGNASGRARLEQWATAPEVRVGNPLEAQADWFHTQFLNLVARHKA